MNQVKGPKPKNLYLALVSHKPGVYALCDKNDKIIYVGQSIDMYKRCWTHDHSKSKEGSMYAKELAIEADQTKRLELEMYYIRKYSPNLNVMGLKTISSSRSVIALEIDGTKYYVSNKHIYGFNLTTNKDQTKDYTIEEVLEHAPYYKDKLCM